MVGKTTDSLLTAVVISVADSPICIEDRMPAVDVVPRSSATGSERLCDFAFGAEVVNAGRTLLSDADATRPLREAAVEVTFSDAIPIAVELSSLPIEDKGVLLAAAETSGGLTDLVLETVV